MFRIALLFTFLSFSHATTCSQLRTLYSDLTCCENQNVDTCLRSIPLCANTTNGKICIDTNNDAIIKGGNSTVINVDNTTIKQYDNGTIYAVGSSSATSTAVVTKEGQVLEELIGVCDGSAVTVESGTYTLTDVTAKQTTTTAFVTLTGSEINYKPPTGTTQVIYQFSAVKSAPTNNHLFFKTRLVIDNTPVSNLAPSIGKAVSAHHGEMLTFKYVVEVGTEDIANGQVATWNTAKSLKLEVQQTGGASHNGYTAEVRYNGYCTGVPNVGIYEGSTDNPGTHVEQVQRCLEGCIDKITPFSGTWTSTNALSFHISAGRCWCVSQTWSSCTTPQGHQTYITYDIVPYTIDFHRKASSTDIIKPILNIRAIGLEISYVGFDPTPTALLSAQTFEVTSEECMSSALITSIKAQVAAKLSADHAYGTTAESVVSLSTMQPGCAYYSSPDYPDQHGGTIYNRVLFNTNANGADTSDIDSFAICKYANGDYVLLTDPTAKCKTVHFTLPDNLNTLAGVLQTDSTKLGIGVTPEASFHIGLSENVDVNVSRFECDGSGAIIEQTSGELTTVMSQSDCSVLANYSTTVPTVSAVKKYDGLCSTSTSNSPYNYNVLVQNTGSHAGGSKHLTFAECKTYGLTTSGYYWATDSGNDAGTLSVTSSPPGCSIYIGVSTPYPVYWNSNLASTRGCSTTQRCLLKLNVKVLSSGTPPNDVSEAECKAYGESIGKWDRTDSFTNIPQGCFRNSGFEPNTQVYYNTHANSNSCSYNRNCIAKDTTYDNPGTTDQARIDACRDACTDRSKPLFSGSWDFRSASFWVEPTGGECHCGAEPAGTCATTASDFIDLYELNNPPKGCFRDSSGNHYHNNPSDDNYGVCSTTYKCLRNDEDCLVRDQTNETKSISLISEQSAWFKNEIIVSSDQRIKTNITHVDNALSILRDIPTRYYDYVDHRRGSSTIGFLAQEVAQVLPSAVKKQKGFIPSHMKRITCVFNYTDALRIHCPELDDDKKYKLYVSNPDEGEKSLEIRNHGVIDKVYTSIYCFGEEVEDFHVLEKSKLFAIAFSATQELDKLVSTLRQEVDELKAKVYN